MPSSIMRSSPLRRCVLGTTQFSQFSRTYASFPSNQRMKREMDRVAKQSSKKTDLESFSAMQKRANDEYFKSGGGPLFPGTFVPLPLSRVSKSPNDFFRYQYFRLKQWGMEKLSIVQMKLKSMPDWTTRPQWKVGRGKIAPTAKVMYTEMLEAFAAGDKATINKLCLGQFAKKLSAAIDRRNPAQRTIFRVNKFTKGVFYPRVVAHQVHQVNPYDKEMVTEQAIVAISSEQYAAKQKASTGDMIAGSVKVQDKIEHVVLSRQVSEKTFQAGTWKIWGTVPATTMEAYLEEQEWIKKEQAKRAGWEGPTN